MKTKYIFVCLLAAVITLPLMAQEGSTTNMEILRQKVKADKKLLVATNLNLTEAEGAKFWPVYSAYQEDLQQINQRMSNAILAYADAYDKGTVTDETAQKLLNEAMAIDVAEANLKSALVPKILGVLPATKAARYFQIENKIRAAIRYELAEGIPLVE